MVVNMWRRLFHSRTATISRTRLLVAVQPTACVPAADSNPAPPQLSLAEIGDRFHRFVLGLPVA